TPAEVMDFLAPLNVRDLPGVGSSIAARLESELKVKTVTDIRALTKDRLRTFLGPKMGEKLWENAHGIDNTEVGEVVERKSVSADVNWGVRFENNSQAEEFLHNLA